jgi:hypothetical protein
MVEFLRARVDADTEWATFVLEDPKAGDLHGTARRFLAEAAAKRERIRLWNGLRILREGGGHEYDLAYGTATKGLQLDAAVHSGHPDYLKEWAP